MVDLFYKGELDNNFNETFKNWFTLLKQLFLNRINDIGKQLTDDQLSYLSDILNLKSGYNVEVDFSYFLVFLKYGKTIRNDVKQALIDFLGSHGRVNYLRPIYIEFYKRDKDAALETFEKYRNFYHPIVVKYVEQTLKILS